MKRKSSIGRQQVFTDLRELEKHIITLKATKKKEETLFYIHKIQGLPIWTDKSYHSQGFEQNVYKLKCSCGEQTELNNKFTERDIRIICKHLYWKLTSTKIKNELDPLTKLLLDSFHKNKEMKLFKIFYKDEILILGFNGLDEWVNVFLGKEKWRKYSFNIKEKRWAYNELPDVAKLLYIKINSIWEYINNL